MIGICYKLNSEFFGVRVKTATHTNNFRAFAILLEGMIDEDNCIYFPPGTLGMSWFTLAHGAHILLYNSAVKKLERIGMVNKKYMPFFQSSYFNLRGTKEFQPNLGKLKWKLEK